MFKKLKQSFLVVLSFTFFCGFSAFSQDIEKGKTIYENKRCFECHGHNGEGIKEQEAPRIAGQHEWYILASLKNFSSGDRVNKKMLPFIKGLGEQEFKDLAAFISKL